MNVVITKLLTAFKYLTSLGAIHIIRDTHGGGGGDGTVSPYITQGRDKNINLLLFITLTNDYINQLSL